MNFIFDIGNVLIDFKPKSFLQKLFNDPSAEDIVNDVIFKSREWVQLDQGLITAEEACSRFCLRKPQYKELITTTMDRLPEMLTSIPETAELLPAIKNSGHMLYYLSNYHKELSGYIQNKYSFFSLFDGGVFSCDVHMLKPALEIYRYLLEKYKLDAGECLFIDDTEANVRSAEQLGIKSVLFTGVQKIKHHII